MYTVETDLGMNLLDKNGLSIKTQVSAHFFLRFAQLAPVQALPENNLFDSSLVIEFAKHSMYSNGTKRKISYGSNVTAESKAPKRSSYSLQRQCLLDTSLIKLQLCHMLMEPNLCRSVLIANTVRQIQDEMIQDGSWQVVTDPFMLSCQTPSEPLVATEVLCRPSTPDQDHVPELSSGYAGCREEEVLADQALGSAAHSVEASTISHDRERAPFRMEGCDLQNSTDSRSGLRSEEGERSRQQSKRVRGQVYGKFEIINSAPGSESVVEELFSDVDASYYDIDTMLTGMQTTPKMGPYDLLDSLGSSRGPTSNSSCRPDMNELDHIMEIIVGS
ncbi:cell division cycle-associated protein 4 [Aplochiton taeniatus]